MTRYVDGQSVGLGQSTLLSLNERTTWKPIELVNRSRLLLGALAV